MAILADLEHVTSAWVHCHNTQRPMHRLGRIPPAEAEAAYRATTDTATGRTQRLRCARNPGCFIRTTSVALGI
jgi:hypothetical protein